MSKTPTDANNDETPNRQTFIVKDEATAIRTSLRMKREQNREHQDKYAAIVAREREQARAAERLRKAEIKLELTKLRLNQSASQKARTVIAAASPWMVCLILGGYVSMLSFGEMDSSTTATSSALITLVMTALLSNLRSICSENDVTESNTESTSTTPPPEPNSKP